ncbi:MAG: hypothetical protein ACKOPP_07115 [Bacteroidota bacterium]
MIYNIKFQEQNVASIKNAIDLIHYGLGVKYDLQIIFGKQDEEHCKTLEKQGSNLDEVNKLRNKIGFGPLSPPMNFKVLKKGWSKYLLDGTGLVFAVQTKQFRHKINNEIQNAFDWFIQNKPMFKIETINCPKYDLFFIHLIPSKEETKPDETSVQIPDTTL